MRPNFQGLPWFEFDGLIGDELLLRFLLSRQSDETVVVLFCFQSLGANLVQVFIITYYERSTDHSLT